MSSGSTKARRILRPGIPIAVPLREFKSSSTATSSKNNSRACLPETTGSLIHRSLPRSRPTYTTCEAFSPSSAGQGKGTFCASTIWSRSETCTVPEMRVPLTNVPCSEPRSSSPYPEAVSENRQCLVDTRVSLITRSQSGPLPTIQERSANQGLLPAASSDGYYCVCRGGVGQSYSGIPEHFRWTRRSADWTRRAGVNGGVATLARAWGTANRDESHGLATVATLLRLPDRRK